MTNNDDDETLSSEGDVNQTLVTSALFNPCPRPCSISRETDCDIVTDNDEKEKMNNMGETEIKMKMVIEPKSEDNVHSLQLESSEKDLLLSSHFNNENDYKDEDEESSTPPSDNNRQSIRSLAYLLSPRMSEGVGVGLSAGSSNRTKIEEDEEDEVENKVVADTSNSWAAKLFMKAFDNGRVRSATSISQVGYKEGNFILFPCHTSSVLSVLLSI